MLLKRQRRLRGVLHQSIANGRIKSGAILTTLKPWGMTPTIRRGRESTMRFRPITDWSPPK